MGTSKQTLERGVRLEAALRAQPRRVIAALEDDERLDATPILRDDETLCSAEYVTLVYELHHAVLPELAAERVVEFDRRADEVRRGERFDAVRSAFY